MRKNIGEKLQSSRDLNLLRIEAIAWDKFRLSYFEKKVYLRNV